MIILYELMDISPASSSHSKKLNVSDFTMSLINSVGNLGKLNLTLYLLTNYNSCNSKMDPNLWHYTMINMSAADIFSLCQVDSHFASICNNELFWQRKVLRDYNRTDKPSNLSWRQIYIGLAKDVIKAIPVEYDQIIGHIWISREEFQDETNRKLNSVQ